MDPMSTESAQGTVPKRKAGRRSKGVYKPFSIKARIDIANELEALAGNGVTRTDLFEAAAAMALRDKEALLAEVKAQRALAAQHRIAVGLPPTKGDRDVAA